MIDLIKPNEQELKALARREASPRDVDRFEPLCWGPWGNGAVLIGIGILAVIWIPARLVTQGWLRWRHSSSFRDGSSV